MVGVIHRLSDETINQIAAGEVVENPASVVKELVENAVDAKASHILITTQGGGFSSLVVRDNGQGMSPEDVLLCLERHATSKIHSSQDLTFLRTMGFRGEALACVASIAKVTVSSALEGNIGLSVHVQAGKLLYTEPCACPRGTTIEVRSLFYNVPARRKFQKTAMLSNTEIARSVTLLALAHPQIGFELVQEGKTIFSAPCQDKLELLDLLKRRSALLLGEDFQEKGQPVFLEKEECSIYGLISPPLLTRHNRSGQYLFVNNRPVYCLALCLAARDAYATQLSIDRHPLFILHLAIKPSLIDVNVHPQKKEIRLKDEAKIKQHMRSAVSAGLQKMHLDNLPVIDAAAFAQLTPSLALSFSFKEEPFIAPALEQPYVQAEFTWDQPLSAIGIYQHYLLLDAHSVDTHKNGVLWVDLYAAQARIVFERLLEKQHEDLAAQTLLIPLMFSCTKLQAALLSNCIDALHQLGIYMRTMGPTSFIVEAIPACLVNKDLEAILHGIIDQRQNEQHAAIEVERCASIIAQTLRACKKSFSLQEAMEIFKELLRTRDPLCCPRGMATMHAIKKEEISNYFMKL